jgi:hypothetical protein
MAHPTGPETTHAPVAAQAFATLPTEEQHDTFQFEIRIDPLMPMRVHRKRCLSGGQNVLQTCTRDTRNGANNAYPRCNNIARALRDYADTRHILQSHFKNITAEANKPGLQVDA